MLTNFASLWDRTLYWISKCPSSKGRASCQRSARTWMSSLSPSTWSCAMSTPCPRPWATHWGSGLSSSLPRTSKEQHASRSAGATHLHKLPVLLAHPDNRDTNTHRHVGPAAVHVPFFLILVLFYWTVGAATTAVCSSHWLGLWRALAYSPLCLSLTLSLPSSDFCTTSRFPLRDSLPLWTTRNVLVGLGECGYPWWPGSFVLYTSGLEMWKRCSSSTQLKNQQKVHVEILAWHVFRNPMKRCLFYTLPKPGQRHSDSMCGKLLSWAHFENFWLSWGQHVPHT